MIEEGKEQISNRVFSTKTLFSRPIVIKSHDPHAFRKCSALRLIKSNQEKLIKGTNL
jgi:hypothetical protein